jgi:hypothetical protein
MPDKYIKELISEIFFEATDLEKGNSYKELGCDSKKDFFKELRSRLEQLEVKELRSRLEQLEERLAVKGIILNDE